MSFSSRLFKDMIVSYKMASPPTSVLDISPSLLCPIMTKRA